MPFVQTNVNYAAEYSRSLAQAYPYLSYFGDIWASPNSELYKPGMGKTMYIPSMSVKGAHAADRNHITGDFDRNWNNEYQAVTLDMDREWDTLIDPMDIVETDDVATIANVTRVFNETQKIPEMDAYMAAKLRSFVDTPDTTVLTAANVLAMWDDYLAAMTDARVPRDRVRAYMSPAVYKLLKQAVGMDRFLNVGANTGNLDRNVGFLDHVKVSEVPSDIMKTSFDFTEGWVAAANAKQINLILVDPMAIAAPVKYDISMMSAPSAQSKGKYLYYERYYYGAFALKNRKNGIIVNTAA